MTRKLTDLLDDSESQGLLGPTEESIYGILRSWGAGLVWGDAPDKPLTLEETLTYGVELARRDPDVAQAWPVVLAKNRDRVRLDRPETQIRRLGQKTALGFLLPRTGLLPRDSTLPAFAGRFRDSRVRKAQDFFTLPRGKRMRALVEAKTPELARRWYFRMNPRLHSFRDHFGKFVGSS